MKRQFAFTIIFIICLFILIFSGCVKDEDDNIEINQNENVEEEQTTNDDFEKGSGYFIYKGISFDTDYNYLEKLEDENKSPNYLYNLQITDIRVGIEDILTLKTTFTGVEFNINSLSQDRLNIGTYYYTEIPKKDKLAFNDGSFFVNLSGELQLFQNPEITNISGEYHKIIDGVIEIDKNLNIYEVTYEIIIETGDTINGSYLGNLTVQSSPNN